MKEQNNTFPVGSFKYWQVVAPSYIAEIFISLKWLSNSRRSEKPMGVPLKKTRHG